MVKTLNRLRTSKDRIFHTRSATGCRTPVSTARDTKPTAVATVTFSLHQGASKKKKKEASEEYNFY